MNSAQTTKKKISEYQIEDIKELFSGFLKKISSKIILIEIGNNFLNIGLAKSQKNKLYIKKVFKEEIPENALEKSIPTDPKSFGLFLKQVMYENKINTNRISLSLPSDACYTRLIDIPEEVKENDSKSFLEDPDSGIQVPISLENSDFDICLTNLPKKESKNKTYNKYFLTSLPKKNVDIIIDSIKNADLEICSIQMSHNCIANLLKPAIDNLDENELIISVDLLDEFTQFVIFDKSGPLSIKRLASIRKYPSIEEMKQINTSKKDKIKNSKSQNKSEIYHPLSKLDLKILLREINDSFNNFLKNNNLNKKGKIFLSGRNSQHKNLVELVGKSLKMDVALISPINTYSLKEFSYNPDEINQFSMSRLIGLGLTLIKNNDLEDESSYKQFISQYFSYKEDTNENLKEDMQKDSIEIPDNTISDLMNSLDKLSEENNKIKEKAETKIKSEENKKELPPLPNLKIKEKAETKIKSEENKKEIKKNKSFKVDKSFLKDD